MGRPLRRILVVDDDPDIREVASLTLVSLGGYAVQVCETAAEAVARVTFFRPDLILLDVMMPGTDGPGALRALRTVNATARTPVVFLTARVGRQEFRQYEELGCLGVIAKPFDPTLLPGTLEAMWARHLDERKERHRRDFEVLHRAYMEELTEKVGAMQAAAAALASGGWDRPTMEALFHQAHRIAGSSGVYGLSALSRAAGILEDRVKTLLDAPTWPPADCPDELATVVKAVRQAARSAARNAPGTAPLRERAIPPSDPSGWTPSEP